MLKATVGVGRMVDVTKNLKDEFAMAAIPYCQEGLAPFDLAIEAYTIADAMMQIKINGLWWAINERAERSAK